MHGRAARPRPLPAALVAALVVALLTGLLGCAGTDRPGEGPTDPASSSSSPSGTVAACAVAGFEPTERTDVRRGTRVVLYALPLTLGPGRRGRVPVTLRRVLDLRPGVRAPDGGRVDADVLRRVAAALPGGSTGPLSETFATRLQVSRAAQRPRRVVAYAATRARPFDWTARVCGPPSTTDGSAADVVGTGLLVERFTTGRVACDATGRAAARRDPVARQLLALCG
ncbi:hypothetical protein [Nocardioides aurantiacus]|uniref:Lipoprotein n=1 Tax=Nocardioides aurantiacus TaxID=86796 RepID=A0A3N2CV29_9ACTN|nr:hypothetical protein [Nocardioides aurantiacus]ROR91268.1 hypothetical protein EDD33_2134 [Nocardioides aurantiacus]